MFLLENTEEHWSVHHDAIEIAVKFLDALHGTGTSYKGLRRGWRRTGGDLGAEGCIGVTDGVHDLDALAVMVAIGVLHVIGVLVALAVLGVRVMVLVSLMPSAIWCL